MNELLKILGKLFILACALGIIFTNIPQVEYAGAIMCFCIVVGWILHEALED